MEFLDYVKVIEGKALPKVNPDETFLKITSDQMKGIPNPSPENADTFDWMVNELGKEIVQELPASHRSKFQASVAVGCLEHASVNAQILRSTDNYYAIVLNKGLMLLAHKLVKLAAAAREPSAVIYCNRGEPSQFGKFAYLEMIDEMLSHYAQTGVPLGPRIKFDMDSKVGISASSDVNMVELFVLSHEVGHFVNGDLVDLNRFSTWHMGEGIGFFKNEHLHKCEFAADKFAFEHVMRIMYSKMPELPALSVLFSAATLTFNLLRGISNRESYSHPAASVRLVTLTRTFFGEAAADLMERSFADPRLLENLRAEVGSTTISDLLQRQILTST